MGKMAELAYEQEQINQAVAIARMEAEHEAIPKTLAESLEINKQLREHVALLSERVAESTSPQARNRERAIGFALGVIASLVAAFIWWLAAQHWTALK